MVRKFKYSLLDIKNNKRMYIVFLIQMLVVILLITSILTDIRGTRQYLKNMTQLLEEKAYVPIDSTTSEHLNYIMNEDKNTIPKLKELYSTIINNENIIRYSSYSYFLEEYVMGEQVRFHYIDKNYNDISPLTVIKGRKFNSSDFTEETSVIPVIIGYNLRDKYIVGEVYEIIDPIEGKNKIEYEIIGVLDHNESFISINYGITDFLNYSIIRPISEKSVDEIKQFSEFDLRINNNFIATKGISEIQKIENKSRELDLFSIKYKLISEVVKSNLDFSRSKIIYSIFICIIILLFTLIGIISSIIQMLNVSIRNYTIHILCGATKMDMIKRIVISLTIVELIVAIPIIIILGLNIDILITLLVIILINLLILIFPLNKLRKTEISMMIKRG